MSHTISPILGRIMRPLFMRKMFEPAPCLGSSTNFRKRWLFGDRKFAPAPLRQLS